MVACRRDFSPTAAAAARDALLFPSAMAGSFVSQALTLLLFPLLLRFWSRATPLGLALLVTLASLLVVPAVSGIFLLTFSLPPSLPPPHEPGHACPPSGILIAAAVAAAQQQKSLFVLLITRRTSSAAVMPPGCNRGLTRSHPPLTNSAHLPLLLLLVILLPPPLPSSSQRQHDHRSRSSVPHLPKRPVCSLDGKSRV